MNVGTLQRIFGENNDRTLMEAIRSNYLTYRKDYTNRCMESRHRNRQMEKENNIGNIFDLKTGKKRRQNIKEHNYIKTTTHRKV